MPIDGEQLTQLAQRLADLFEGRTDAYGFTDITGPRDTNGKIPCKCGVIREPVTVDLWKAHLLGKRGLGIFTVRKDNTVKWAVLDVDQYDFNHQAYIQKLRSLAIPLLVARSKSGGGHLFAFFKKPVPAASVIDLFKIIKRKLSLSPATEIFPKQRTVNADQGDLGNWLNMPYFDAANTQRFGFDPSGNPMSLPDWLDYVEQHMTRAGTLEVFRALRKEPPPSAVPFGDGPPCLEHLAKTSIDPGARNNALFAMGVYAKKSDPVGFGAKIEAFNAQYLVPPLPMDEVMKITNSIGNKEYSYKCEEEPCVSCCDKETCIGRAYGIGKEMVAMGNLTKVLAQPPFWFLDVDGVRMKLTTREFTRQAEFKLRCVETINKMPAQMQADAWRVTRNRLLANRQEITLPIDATPEGQFLEFFSSYIEEHLDDTDNRERLALGRVVANGGYLFFLFHNLTAYLKRAEFKIWTSQEIAEYMKGPKLACLASELVLKGKRTRVWAVHEDRVSIASAGGFDEADQQVNGFDFDEGKQ